MVSLLASNHSFSNPMKTNSARKLLKLSTLALITVSLLLLCPLQTRADTVALSFSSHSGEGTTQNVTAGWSFTLSSNISVTELGAWDGNNSVAFGPPDGLTSDQLITIWTSAGTLVTSATVPAGSGTLVNDFRFVSIAPTLLTAGSYVIGDYYSPTNSDPNAAISSTITTAPGVTYGQGLDGVGNAFPTSPFAGGGIWGPNFQFVPAGVSTPDTGSTLYLLGLALAGLFGVSRIRSLRLA